MTPKEKAESLVRRMTVDFSIDSWQSKQCAVIAVDEIISHIEPSIPIDTLKIRLEYWKEVIEEIEKL